MQTTFILASLAGSALASHVLNAAPILKRDLEAIQPRATDSPSGTEGLEACQSAAMDLLTSLPTPPPKIQSDVIKNPQTGDPCSFSTPASLSADYSSYSEDLMSWYSKNEDQIKSAVAACTDLAELGGDVINVCSTELPSGLEEAAATKTSGSDSTETDSSSSEETSAGSEDSETSTSTGGAPRATGMAVAGLAAGLMAAVL